MTDHTGVGVKWLLGQGLKFCLTTEIFFFFLEQLGLEHTRQMQGPRAESGPSPCFIRPGTLFLPRGIVELLAPS